MPQETQYSAVFTTPAFYQRNTTQTAELRVEYEGALAVPSSGNYSLWDETGTALVDSQAVTVSNGLATYQIADTVLPTTKALSDLYIERWDLVMPDGKTYGFRRDAALCLYRLYPPVGESQLKRQHTELRDWLAADQNSIQPIIDTAWDYFLSRLMGDERKPYLILSPGACFAPLTNLIWAIFFRDAMVSTSDAGKYGRMAEFYQQQYELEYDRLQLKYDFNEDDRIDEDEKATAAQPVLYTVKVGDWTLPND